MFAVPSFFCVFFLGPTEYTSGRSHIYSCLVLFCVCKPILLFRWPFYVLIQRLCTSSRHSFCSRSRQQHISFPWPWFFWSAPPCWRSPCYGSVQTQRFVRKLNESRWFQAVQLTEQEKEITLTLSHKLLVDKMMGSPCRSIAIIHEEMQKTKIPMFQ